MKYMSLRIIVLLASLVLVSQASGNSLYLEYVEKSEADLKAETRELSREIRNTFDMASMESAQQKIDAYDYLSHFKKVLLYGSKLATYSRYEEDLAFALDNELFKGLPEDEETEQKVKKDFLDEKYQRMNTDVKNEIDTYQDLILISLDACELLTANDFTGFSESRVFKAKMHGFMQSGRSYKAYREKEERFAAAWPELADRIRQQVMLWEAAPKVTGDALVDPNITKAIFGDDGA